MLLRNALSMCRRVTPLWQAQFSTLFGGDPINGTTAQELQIGIQFPLDENGGRSTIASGKSIIAAALRGAQTEEGDRLALSSETEKDWRLNYPKHFLDLVKYAATRYTHGRRVLGYIKYLIIRIQPRY